MTLAVRERHFRARGRANVRWRAEQHDALALANAPRGAYSRFERRDAEHICIAAVTSAARAYVDAAIADVATAHPEQAAAARSLFDRGVAKLQTGESAAAVGLFRKALKKIRSLLAP